MEQGILESDILPDIFYELSDIIAKGGYGCVVEGTMIFPEGKKKVALKFLSEKNGRKVKNMFSELLKNTYPECRYSNLSCLIDVLELGEEWKKLPYNGLTDILFSDISKKNDRRISVLVYELLTPFFETIFETSEELLSTMFKCLVAVAELHSLGLAHQDIHAGNFLKNEKENSIVLADLDDVCNDENRCCFYGYVNYLSPSKFLKYMEFLKTKEKTCESLEEAMKTDIWALGMTFIRFAKNASRGVRDFFIRMEYRYKKGIYPVLNQEDVDNYLTTEVFNRNTDILVSKIIFSMLRIEGRPSAKECLVTFFPEKSSRLLFLSNFESQWNVPDFKISKDFPEPFETEDISEEDTFVTYAVM